MARFKCKATGTVIEFIHPVDIETTRENPAYEEIIEEKEEKKTIKKVKAEQ